MRGPPAYAPRVAVLATTAGITNTLLVEGWAGLGVDVELVRPSDARTFLRDGDTVLGRLDVRRTLDGVEPGLMELLWLERRGLRVLNPASALAAAHDKLLTARLLARAGLPHPRTEHVWPGGAMPGVEPPVVVKPRLGSWGIDVFRCETVQELERVIREVRRRPWFRRHGALLQELVPPVGHDLRLVVAGGVVVGAVRRIPAAGEWRTNVSLGARRVPIEPSAEAAALGVAAAAAVGADLVGVDLLPAGDGHVVIELNGAADFDLTYSLTRGDVLRDAAIALGLVPAQVPSGRHRHRPVVPEAVRTIHSAA
jgi:[lysine-biosynthesis-protein LysW]---L-2-aminoadipate ligase